MKVLAVVLAAFSSTAALADGFVCESPRDGITVKVFNHTSPEKGTRVPAVMVISDPRAERGERTLAKFTQTNISLSEGSAVYNARVDLRYNDTNKDGKIAGVPIDTLSHISLKVDFNFARPIQDGARVDGLFYLNTRDGDTLPHYVACTRYLKN